MTTVIGSPTTTPAAGSPTVTGPTNPTGGSPIVSPPTPPVTPPNGGGSTPPPGGGSTPPTGGGSTPPPGGGGDTTPPAGGGPTSPPGGGGQPTPPPSPPPPSPPTTTETPSTTLSRLTTPLTTVVQATLATTDSAGSISYKTVSSTEVYSAGSMITATLSPHSNAANSSSHTGAIAGGVIGGIALLALLSLLAVWYRSKHRYDDEFDGNFDPDHVVNGSSVKRASSGIGHHDFGPEASVTPFAFPDSAPHPAPHLSNGPGFGPGPGPHGPGPVPQPNMAQYPHGPVVNPNHPTVIPSEKSQVYSTDYATAIDSSRRPHSDSSQYNSSGGPSSMPMVMGAMATHPDWHSVSPGPSDSSSAVGTSSNSSSGAALLQSRNAKEREALAHYGGRVNGGLGLASQSEDDPGYSQATYLSPSPPPQLQYQPQQAQYDPRYSAEQHQPPPGTFGPIGLYGPPGSYIPQQHQQQQQQPMPQPGPSRRSSAGVVVHQDGGRIRTKEEEAEEQRLATHEEVPEEIPPTYDSIRR